MATWTLAHNFWLTTHGEHDDTLEVAAPAGPEHMFSIALPTLCITYADMTFTNQIGGEQLPYPSSRAYAAKFTPDITIAAADVERLTWIRGAVSVTIGAAQTTITWRGGPLLIPRLRIERGVDVQATIRASRVAVPNRGEVFIDTLHRADGFRIGGLRVTKRGPRWERPKVAETSSLAVQVVDAETGRPFQEVPVRRRESHAKANDRENFVEVDRGSTSHDGWWVQPSIRSDVLNEVTIDRPDLQCEPRRFRALPGEPVRLRLHARKVVTKAR